ncbi:SagB family peptide dehydrogenase [Brevibacillus sp. GCM10020057]|uniref:SagB family peptide dehydrogenase n=1 Tax=Brevibacillus sp. GCM10020057 TaxID=3317327 RepID=UPI003636D7B2
MELTDFLRELHFDSERLKPPDYAVDWADAPLPYKLYRGLPTLPLSLEVPLTLADRQVSVQPGLQEIGHFLWYVYGLAHFTQTVLGEGAHGQGGGALLQSVRRFVPSGGGLYPCELYVYLREEGRRGIYHYDSAHHRLVFLREGQFDEYVGAALGGRCDLSACFATVFVSTMYWKNFFKYHNFAYRLQGLDAGVVIGQLLEVAKRFGYETGVYFQFLDRAVHHLLGLSEQEESVYAVLPLSVDRGGRAWQSSGGEGAGATADELCRQLPALAHEHYVRSRTIKPYPQLIRINAAAQLESPRSFRTQEATADADSRAGETIALPRVPRMAYDMAAACRRRFSPELDFCMGKISLLQLSALLHEAAASFSYRNDLDANQSAAAWRVKLYGCLHCVDGIADGAYRYDPAVHALCAVRTGDHRLRLQYAMSLDNVNLLQVPLCFHVAGDRGHLRELWGYRGYRIQQMEAGMLVQRLLLASAAAELGGHPLLGYDSHACDELYRLTPRGETSLIQIPVGPYRHRPRLQGGLHG